MSGARKPILCLDMDGVLHGYQSGWLGADRMPDPPVPGAMRALQAYVERFRVAVFSSRTGQRGGLHAMREWLRHCLVEELGIEEGDRVSSLVEWPMEKPPALVTIDDRALTFDGTWPTVERLAAFQPWNKLPTARPPVLDPVYDAVAYAVNASDLDGEHPEHEDWCASVNSFLAALERRGYQVVKAPAR